MPMCGQVGVERGGKVGNICLCVPGVVCDTERIICGTALRSLVVINVGNTMDYQNNVGPCHRMAWPWRGNCGPRDLAVIDTRSLLFAS